MIMHKQLLFGQNQIGHSHTFRPRLLRPIQAQQAKALANRGTDGTDCQPGVKDKSHAQDQPNLGLMARKLDLKASKVVLIDYLAHVTLQAFLKGLGRRHKRLACKTRKT